MKTVRISLRKDGHSDSRWRIRASKLIQAVASLFEMAQAWRNLADKLAERRMAQQPQPDEDAK